MESIPDNFCIIKHYQWEVGLMEPSSPGSTMPMFSSVYVDVIKSVKGIGLYIYMYLK